MKKGLTYEVTKVKHLGDYRLKITYADSYSVAVDFTKALEKYAAGQFSQSGSSPANFKKFKSPMATLYGAAIGIYFFCPKPFAVKGLN